MIDDYYQHKIQVLNPSYRSLVNRFYGNYMYKPIRKFMYKIGLGKFFDKF